MTRPTVEIWLHPVKIGVQAQLNYSFPQAACYATNSRFERTNQQNRRLIGCLLVPTLGRTYCRAVTAKGS